MAEKPNQTDGPQASSSNPWWRFWDAPEKKEDVVGGLLESVGLLAEHAVQVGRVPDNVDIGVIYTAKLDRIENKDLSVETVRKLVAYYQLLQKQFTNVTPRALSATTPTIPGKMQTSPAGRYLFKLWVFTVFIIVLILATNFLQYYHKFKLPRFEEDWDATFFTINYVYQFTLYMEPFVYGTLGALAHMLRVTASTLESREFDPARAPEHINRIILGTLSGGTIILFITQVPAEEDTFLQISSAALGFLAGYSVDFLFQTVDRIIQAILPKVGLSTVQLRSRERHHQALVERYEEQLAKTKKPAEKKILRDIIADLKEL